jgi:uncharacterized integral membrane protein
MASKAIPVVLLRIQRRQVMYLSLVITTLLLMGIVITGIQNSMPLEVKFIVWNHQMSLTALIFYSSVFGGAVVAVLALPKLVRKCLQVRRLNKEMVSLKQRVLELEKGHVGGSQTG